MKLVNEVTIAVPSAQAEDIYTFWLAGGGNGRKGRGGANGESSPAVGGIFIIGLRPRLVRFHQDSCSTKPLPMVSHRLGITDSRTLTYSASE